MHTTVSIGYSAPWQTVHKLLINAALSTENILNDPMPFVLQKQLNDFYITYQINAYTTVPKLMEHTYSVLHQNIQNKFNEAGVEIMSPHYTSIRDGNHIAIPNEYVSNEYNQPTFNIKQSNDHK